jgi:hypothetical protein
VITTFHFEPLVGPVPIRFGDSQGAIAQKVGPFLAVSTNKSGEPEERFETFVVRYSPSALRVVEVSFIPGSRLLYLGKFLFECEDPARFIQSHGFHAQEMLGFHIFHELGIAIAGFDTGQSNDQGITVFEQGRWDDFRQC